VRFRDSVPRLCPGRRSPPLDRRIYVIAGSSPTRPALVCQSFANMMGGPAHPQASGSRPVNGAMGLALGVLIRTQERDRGIRAGSGDRVRSSGRRGSAQDDADWITTG
jgi:hypothetical protein